MVKEWEKKVTVLQVNLDLIGRLICVNMRSKVDLTLLTVQLS